jgi:hypothetical protein
MKEFPHRHFQILEKLRQSADSSTFVVKPYNGTDNPLILRLYSGITARSKAKILEDNLCWQRGLTHPYLLGITTAGISEVTVSLQPPIFQRNSSTCQSKSGECNPLLDVVCFLHKHWEAAWTHQPSNIFSLQGSVCLADMRVVDSTEFSSLDDIRFTAPEVLLGGAPTFESDYYSLGAILYRIYVGRDPI